jgi:hypothetical protein
MVMGPSGRTAIGASLPTRSNSRAILWLATSTLIEVLLTKSGKTCWRRSVTSNHFTAYARKITGFSIFFGPSWHPYSIFRLLTARPLFSEIRKLGCAGQV